MPTSTSPYPGKPNESFFRVNIIVIFYRADTVPQKYHQMHVEHDTHKTHLPQAYSILFY